MKPRVTEASIAKFSPPKLASLLFLTIKVGAKIIVVFKIIFRNIFKIKDGLNRQQWIRRLEVLRIDPRRFPTFSPDCSPRFYIRSFLRSQLISFDGY